MAKGNKFNVKKNRGAASNNDPDLEEFFKNSPGYFGGHYYSRKMNSSKGRGKRVGKGQRVAEPNFDPVLDNPSLRSFRGNRMLERHEQMNMGQNKRGKNRASFQPKNKEVSSSRKPKPVKQQNKPQKIYNSAHPNSYRAAWLQNNSKVPYVYVDSSDSENEDADPTILTQVERIPNSELALEEEDSAMDSSNSEPGASNLISEAQPYEPCPSFGSHILLNYPVTSEAGNEEDGFYIDTVGFQKPSTSKDLSTRAVSSTKLEVEIEQSHTQKIISQSITPFTSNHASQLQSDMEDSASQEEQGGLLENLQSDLESASDDLLQDYIENMDVDDLNLKLNKFQMDSDQTSSSEHSEDNFNDDDSGDETGNTSYDEFMIDDDKDTKDFDLGLLSDDTSAYADGFSEGVQFVLDLLPKHKRPKVIKQIVQMLPPNMLPPCLQKPDSSRKNLKERHTTKSKRIETGRPNPDKSSNEDRRQTVRINSSSLNAANAALLELLHNKHRKSALFSFQSKHHSRAIKALSSEYNLTIKSSPNSSKLRILKSRMSGIPLDTTNIDRLLGIANPNHTSIKLKYTKVSVKKTEAKAQPGTPIPSSNIGHQLLSKMGWAPGQALGVNGTGILEPIQASVRKKNQGLGA